MNGEASQISGERHKIACRFRPERSARFSVPKLHPAFPVRDFETVDDRFVHKHGMIRKPYLKRYFKVWNLEIVGTKGVDRSCHLR